MLITKRDGSDEDWSDDKIATSIIRSGLQSEEAEQFIEKIKTQIKSEKISSAALKEIILKELKLSHPEAAVMYENYKK